MFTHHFLLWIILAFVSYITILITCLRCAEKYAKLEFLEAQMAADWVKQFGGTYEEAQWIVKSARPSKK